MTLVHTMPNIYPGHNTEITSKISLEIFLFAVVLDFAF